MLSNIAFNSSFLKWTLVSLIFVLYSSCTKNDINTCNLDYEYFQGKAFILKSIKCDSNMRTLYISEIRVDSFLEELKFDTEYRKGLKKTIQVSHTGQKVETTSKFEYNLYSASNDLFLEEENSNGSIMITNYIATILNCSSFILQTKTHSGPSGKVFYLRYQEI